MSNSNLIKREGVRNGAFITKPANQWVKEASLKSIPNQLWGPFWYEDEICILFADTNLGKSILAVQIAVALTHGRKGEKCDSLSSVRPWDFGNIAVETAPKRVLYLDFEMSGHQFTRRYSRISEDGLLNSSGHPFTNNFIRSELNPDDDLGQFRSYNDKFWHDLGVTVAENRCEVLIVDNITYLADEMETARYALPLMKRIKEFKKNYGISVLLLAHTPKRDPARPLDRNDLMGSKMLINFCDSSFTIGESDKDPNLRYIKQIKARNIEIVHNAENVILCSIEKKNDNFLGFEYIGLGREKDHLWTEAARNRNELKKQAVELSRQGLSLREVGNQLGISRMTVSRWLEPKENCHILPLSE